MANAITFIHCDLTTQAKHVRMMSQIWQLKLADALCRKQLLGCVITIRVMRDIRQWGKDIKFTKTPQIPLLLWKHLVAMETPASAADL